MQRPHRSLNHQTQFNSILLCRHSPMAIPAAFKHPRLSVLLQSRPLSLLVPDAGVDEHVDTRSISNGNHGVVQTGER